MLKKLLFEFIIKQGVDFIIDLVKYFLEKDGITGNEQFVINLLDILDELNDDYTYPSKK